jgi:hypothetical protein
MGSVIIGDCCLSHLFGELGNLAVKGFEVLDFLLPCRLVSRLAALDLTIFFSPGLMTHFEAF